MDYSRDCHEKRHFVYLFKPETYHDLDQLKEADTQAKRYLSDLQETIEEVKQHRLNLAERANYLALTPSVLSVELHRYKADNVTFVLSHIRRYPDGTETEEKRTKFSGKERHVAIAAYRKELKSHPGVNAVLDIEKGKWER